MQELIVPSAILGRVDDGSQCVRSPARVGASHEGPMEYTSESANAAMSYLITVCLITSTRDGATKVDRRSREIINP